MDTILTEDEAKALYEHGDAAHDFDHVLRVTRLAVQIARAEGADVTVVRLAALLHDAPSAVAETQGALRTEHHRAAAEFARRELTGRGLAAHQVDNVVHSIEAHRFRERTVQPQTLEAQCLYDADKLDSIGAIGVARTYAYAGSHGNRLWTSSQTTIDPHAPLPTGAEYTPVHEYVFKLQHILGTLYTAAARAMGARRHERMVEFFAQLDAEMMSVSSGS